MFPLARPLLFRLDAERAHDLTLAALEAARCAGLAGLLHSVPPLPVRALGLEFANPVGLAAGLDKNGAHVDALAALGFGFIEVGTVTPRPQPGNPKPRLFRLPRHSAVINRMGFNNDGVDALARNIERARYAGVLGVNIGRNKDTPNERATDDYLHCLERVYPRADYVALNVSSPNTPGLRELQQRDALHRLAGTLAAARDALHARHGARKSLLLKVAPDLDDAQMDAIADAVRDTGIDGLICTNTTTDRPGVTGERFADEPGGLSGAPLFAKSTSVLRGFRSRLGMRTTLVGTGGILSGADAAAKVEAGAALVQSYTGLVFRGPGLIRDCVVSIRDRGGA